MNLSYLHFVKPSPITTPRTVTSYTVAQRGSRGKISNLPLIVIRASRARFTGGTPESRLPPKTLVDKFNHSSYSPKSLGAAAVRFGQLEGTSAPPLTHNCRH